MKTEIKLTREEILFNKLVRKGCLRKVLKKINKPIKYQQTNLEMIYYKIDDIIDDKLEKELLKKVKDYIVDEHYISGDNSMFFVIADALNNHGKSALHSFIGKDMFYLNEYLKDNPTRNFNNLLEKICE